MPNKPDSLLTVLDVPRVLFRHKWKASAVLVVVFGAAVAAALLLPPVYRSEGKLFVRLGRENSVLDPTAGHGEQPIVAVPPTREWEINTVVDILRSRLLAEKVVDALGPQFLLTPATGGEADAEAAPQGGLDRVRELLQVPGWVLAAKDWVRQVSRTPLLTDRDRAIHTVCENLAVEAVRKSNLVSVSYQGRSPDLCRSVVAKLLDSYLEEHVRANRTRGSYEFFAQQTALTRAQLAQKEDELRALQAKTELVAPEHQRRLLVERQARLEEELLGVESAKASGETKVRQLHANLTQLPKEHVAASTAGVGDEGTDRMRDQFYALRLRQQEAAAKYTGQHPELQRLEEQVARAQEILGREDRTRTHVTTEPDRLHEYVRQSVLVEEPAIKSLQSKADVLSAQVAGVREQLKTLGENELRITRLQREVDLLAANSRKHAISLEQTRIDAQLEAQQISSINVVQPATLEARPVRPQRALILAFGLLAAVFSSVALALTAEHLDHSFRTPEDVERHLDLPAVASFPRLKPHQLVPTARN